MKYIVVLIFEIGTLIVVQAYLGPTKTTRAAAWTTKRVFLLATEHAACCCCQKVIFKYFYISFFNAFAIKTLIWERVGVKLIMLTIFLLQTNLKSSSL